MPVPSFSRADGGQHRRLPLVGEVRPERLRSGGRELVGPPPVVALERLDHALGLQPAQRLIERPGREPDPGEGLDVLGQRVAVLGAVGEARQDQVAGPA